MGACEGTGVWNELSRLQQSLLSALEDHARLCEAAVPDRNAISAARWRVAQAGRVRMEFLTISAIPAAEAASAGDMLRRVIALRDGTPDYQRQVSSHVARWPTEAIVTDWDEYRVLAKAFRARVQARVAEEAMVMRPALLRAAALARRAPPTV